MDGLSQMAQPPILSLFVKHKQYYNIKLTHLVSIVEKSQFLYEAKSTLRSLTSPSGQPKLSVGQRFLPNLQRREAVTFTSMPEASHLHVNLIICKEKGGIS